MNLVTQSFIALGKTLRIMAFNRVGFAGFLAVVAIVLISYVGPRFMELDRETKVDHIFQSPTAEFWLGTDHQGRDILSQIVHGGRDVIEVALIAGALSTIIAVTFGTLAGFRGGWIDGIVTAITDIFLTIPGLPLLLVLASVLKLDDVALLGVLLGALGWPALLRAVRSQALSLKERDFVEAARSLDLGTWHIVFREIVPNMMTYIIVSFALAMTAAIYLQVALVLFGVVPFSGSNWGVMLSLAYSRGAHFNPQSIWTIMMPVLAIVLLQLAIITMTRSLELIFNPRLRADA